MPDTNKLRSAALWTWFIALCQTLKLGTPQGELQTVSGDASFRRYFRACTDQGAWILVDAPVERENSKPFVEVGQSLAAAGVKVPQVLAADLEQGFMCLQDFGSELLLSRLNTVRSANMATTENKAATGLYQQAFDELLLIQRCDPCKPALPRFDRAMLLREMLLFTDWLCKDFLQLELSAQETALLSAVHETLIASALAQPQVYVHRDYHSRNLMLLQSGLGVIDFQDAVVGPFTYDLVSLLKDCYINWPAELVQQWALSYLQQAQSSGIVAAMEHEEFLAYFSLMGVQRHLKAAGIFCRLWLRDGKPGYLQDIPRTLGYISTATFADATLQEFAAWLQRRILPALMLKLQQLEREGLPA